MPVIRAEMAPEIIHHKHASGYKQEHHIAANQTNHAKHIRCVNWAIQNFASYQCLNCCYVKDHGILHELFLHPLLLKSRNKQHIRFHNTL
jgi:hypothetical protein